MRRAMLGLVLVLAGCSSGGPGEAELVEAVETYSVAFTAGDADTAYAMLSERCQDRIGAGEFSDVVSAAGDLYGETSPGTIVVEQLDGNLARVSYSFGVPALDQQSEPWVIEDGSWRVDDC